MLVQSAAHQRKVPLEVEAVQVHNAQCRREVAFERVHLIHTPLGQASGSTSFLRIWALKIAIQCCIRMKSSVVLV